MNVDTILDLYIDWLKDNEFDGEATVEGLSLEFGIERDDIVEALELAGFPVVTDDKLERLYDDVDGDRTRARATMMLLGMPVGEEQFDRIFDEAD